MCLLQCSFFLNKYVYTTVLSFDIVAVDEINFNSIQFNSFKIRILPVMKLTFMKYQATHTNYIISHSTTLPYNHNI